MAFLPPWLQRSDPPGLIELIDRFDLFAYTALIVADRTGTEVPFIENPMQRYVNQLEDRIRAEKGAVWLYQLKMRRGGLSMNTQLRNLHRIWRKPNTRGITLAHEDESTNEIFQITRLAIQRFPEGLLPPMSRERQRAVTFPGMGSRFLTGTAGSTAIGRGSDFSFLHISEFAFVPKPKDLHTAASQALRADGTYIRETTASSYGSEAHEMWQEARSGRSKAQAVFFEWWWRDDAYLPLHDREELDPLDDKEKELLPRLVKFQSELATWYYGIQPTRDELLMRALEQLKWRREKISEIGLTDFNREYPENDTTCWLLAGTPRFDTDALIAARDRDLREPLRKEWNGELRIYKEPDPNKRYLIGGDPSEGLAGDRSAFTVIEHETWDQVAAFSSRTVPPEGLAERMNVIGRRYASGKYGPAVLVPERNAAGYTVLDRLLNVMRPRYPKGRVWHYTKLVKQERTKEPGWRTTEETKYIMIDEGDELLRERRPIIHDQETIEDLLRVQRGKNGTVELTGRDLAVSWLLAYQGRKHPVGSGDMSIYGDADQQSEASKVSQERF